jgi:hypothetical protein
MTINFCHYDDLPYGCFPNFSAQAPNGTHPSEGLRPAARIPEQEGSSTMTVRPINGASPVDTGVRGGRAGVADVGGDDGTRLVGVVAAVHRAGVVGVDHPRGQGRVVELLGGEDARRALAPGPSSQGDRACQTGYVRCHR